MLSSFQISSIVPSFKSTAYFLISFVVLVTASIFASLIFINRGSMSMSKLSKVVNYYAEEIDGQSDYNSQEEYVVQKEKQNKKEWIENWLSGISINSFSNPFTSPFSSTPINKSEVDLEIDPSEVSTIQTPSLISSTTSSNLMSNISSSLPAFSSFSYYSGYTPYSSYNYQFQSPISLDEVSKDLQERTSNAADYLNLSRSRSTSVASEGRILKSRRGVRTVGFFLV